VEGEQHNIVAVTVLFCNIAVSLRVLIKLHRLSKFQFYLSNSRSEQVLTAKDLVVQ